MSENKNWTKDQLSAIEFGGKDILVCASAGSGKTTVLIERIIRSITDKDTCSDVRKMLVVTFTEAAAAQLKDKLSKAIKKAIRKYPKNKHLRRQLNELPRAHIATINSFCLNVVRNNFEQLGFGSNVRIADEAENKLIMADVMNSCIEEFYNNPSQLGITDFANFCDTFTSLSDSALAEIFLKLYDTLYSQLEGIDLLINNAAKLKEYQAKDPFENIWGTELKKRTGLFLDYFKEKYSEIFDIIAFDEGINKAYGNAVIADNNLLDAIWANLDNGYYAVRKYLLSYEMLALGRYSSKNGNPLDAAKVKNIRNEFKKQISKISELYLYGEKEILTATKETSEFNGKLYTFLSFFHKKVMDEKKRRGVVSFADCEALTLALLCENGEPTPAALKYQSMFDAVYIDEYQDVNSVQDCIFRMISPPNARFLVGDIKQSIYGFRGAEPNIFASYRDSFSDVITSDSVGKRIFLSNNFRSSENITEFANAVSLGCFDKGESSIGFYSGDLLVYSKPEKNEADSMPVTVSVVRENDEKNAEALYVSNEIKKLIDSGVEPNEITILLRSMTSAPVFANELEKIGIPYYCDFKKEFFSNPEITLALCWLNSIDNTRRDIYVCGILKSPVYNFSLDELLDIRKKCPADSLYNSVVEYSQKYNFEKGRRFVDETNELRAFSRGKTASELIWYLLYGKNLMSVVTKGKSRSAAKVSKNNLLLFYDYAKNFENGEFKGLFNFLKYIEQIINAGHALPTAAAFAGAGNTVKIMTVHKSKGLEFPYCFICNTHKATNKADLRKKLLFHRKLGVASKIADKSGLALYNTYISDALKLAIEEEGIQSEFLILYVALTRAVNRMWITASAKEPSDFADYYTEQEISKFYTINNNSYIAWILSSLRYLDNERYTLLFPEPIEDQDEAKQNEGGEITQNTTADIDTIKELIKFEYPYKKHSDIPAKMAVSRLYPDILDDNVSYDMTAILKPKIPYFAAQAKQNKGADIGNATHVFMQFCDFNRVVNNGVEDELEYLVNEGYLSKDAASLVDVSALKVFFASSLFKKIFNSKKIYREKRFNVNLPASDFTKESQNEFLGESVLVQGVIDCFIYDDDGEILLIDYKTDHIPDYISKEKGIDILKQRHATQLQYYKKALEKITASKVKSMILYSFSLGCDIQL